MVALSFSLVALLAAAQAQSQTPAPPPPSKGAPAGQSTGSKSAPPPTAPDLPAPPGATPAQPPAHEGDDISLEEWDRADWQLVQPKTSLVELDGYFRLRSDMLRRINFGNATATEWNAATSTGLQRYVPTDGRSADYSGTNMRLRVEPTINVTEDIHLVTTLDVLDNMTLGSSADTRYTTSNPTSPVNVLDPGQAPAQRGVNSIEDAIVVRRLYARITALNEQLELRFGRMPSEWGLGMMSNAGNCLDCDYGDVVDRLALTFKLADLVFTPMYDWVSSGPAFTPFAHVGAAGYDTTGRSGGQPLDAADWDDVEQYSLRVQKLDGAQAVRERVTAGQTVLNYGAWGIWRRQARDLSNSYYGKVPDTGTVANTPAQWNTDTGAPADDRRDSNIFTADGYGKLYYGNLELGVEAAAIYGKLNVSALNTDGVLQGETVDIWQLGGALEATYHFKGDYDGTSLSLKAGAASGDSSPGFGALDQTASQFGYPRLGEGWNHKLNNFQFSPDYHVDLLLFRHIIGTVTDAWYVRPEVTYAFGNNIGGKLAAIYSQAMFRRSTYSGMYQTFDSKGGVTGTKGSLPLGLEFDGEVSYGLLSTTQGGAFKAAFAGGLLFPLAGFNAPTTDVGDVGGKSFAWTLQGRLYVTF